MLTAVRTGRLGLLPIRIYWGNNAVFVSVDLIGEKNQVILEFNIMTLYKVNLQKHACNDMSQAYFKGYPEIFLL